MRSSNVLDGDNDLPWLDMLVIGQVAKVPSVILELGLQAMRLFDVELLDSQEVDFMLVEIRCEFIVDLIDLEVLPERCDTHRVVSDINDLQ